MSRLLWAGAALVAVPFWLLTLALGVVSIAFFLALLPVVVLGSMLLIVVGGLYEYLWHRVTPRGRAALAAHRALTGEAAGFLWLAKGLVLPVGLAMVPFAVIGALGWVGSWTS